MVHLDQRPARFLARVFTYVQLTTHVAAFRFASPLEARVDFYKNREVYCVTSYLVPGINHTWYQVRTTYWVALPEHNLKCYS